MIIEIVVPSRPDFDFALSQVLVEYKNNMRGRKNEYGDRFNEDYITNLPVKLLEMSISDTDDEEYTYCFEVTGRWEYK